MCANVGMSVHGGVCAVAFGKSNIEAAIETISNIEIEIAIFPDLCFGIFLVSIKL
jgi:hypothetical protein